MACVLTCLFSCLLAAGPCTDGHLVEVTYDNYASFNVNVTFVDVVAMILAPATDALRDSPHDGGLQPPAGEASVFRLRFGVTTPSPNCANPLVVKVSLVADGVQSYAVDFQDRAVVPGSPVRFSHIFLFYLFILSIMLNISVQL